MIKTLKEVEKEHILYVLSLCDGNKTLAAKTLGISRSTMIRRLHEFGAING